jgi:hypothetical protein
VMMSHFADSISFPQREELAYPVLAYPPWRRAHRQPASDPPTATRPTHPTCEREQIAAYRRAHDSLPVILDVTRLFSASQGAKLLFLHLGAIWRNMVNIANLY